MQQEIIEYQQQAIRELSTRVILVLEGIIMMPLLDSTVPIDCRQEQTRLYNPLARR